VLVEVLAPEPEASLLSFVDNNFHRRPIKEGRSLRSLTTAACSLDFLPSAIIVLIDKAGGRIARRRGGTS
jgi:hypothetical protein